MRCESLDKTLIGRLIQQLQSVYKISQVGNSSARCCRDVDTENKVEPISHCPSRATGDVTTVSQPSQTPLSASGIWLQIFAHTVRHGEKWLKNGKTVWGHFTILAILRPFPWPCAISIFRPLFPMFDFPSIFQSIPATWLASQMSSQRCFL